MLGLCSSSISINWEAKKQLQEALIRGTQSLSCAFEVGCSSSNTSSTEVRSYRVSKLSKKTLLFRRKLQRLVTWEREMFKKRSYLHWYRMLRANDSSEKKPLKCTSLVSGGLWRKDCNYLRQTLRWRGNYLNKPMHLGLIKWRGQYSMPFDLQIIYRSEPQLL